MLIRVSLRVRDRWAPITLTGNTSAQRDCSQLAFVIISNFCAVLHDQLLAAQQHLQSQGQEARQPTSQQGHNIDPAISGGAMLAPNTQASSLVLPQVMSGLQEAAGGNDASRKTYGKRELSTSKRAEQNRAAQVCPQPLPPGTKDKTRLTMCREHSANEKKGTSAN